MASAAVFCFSAVNPARAQDNYEIQLYGYGAVEKGHTMLELQNNFKRAGSKTVQDGMRATNHQWDESIEIRPGFNEWFETGFVFLHDTAMRPRVRL